MSTKWSPPTTVLVRRASKLSLLVGLAEPFSSSAPCESTPRSPTPRSPRRFAYDSAVGLRIVAAMNDVPARAAGECGLAAVARTPRTAVAPRSAPIPVVTARRTGPPRKQYGSEEEDGGMSERYTCVVSHVGGGDAVRRRVYLDVDGAGDYCVGCFGVFSGFPPASRLPAPAPAPAAAFLSRCFRCRKRLHGLDIFMYRGDKAFCSEECRCQQMLSDERREKGVSNAVKPHDCSLPLFNSLALRGRVCSCLDMQYPGEESPW